MASKSIGLHFGALLAFCTVAANAQSLASLSCSPSVPAGSSGTCTITLTAKAPASGVPVAIRVAGTGLSVPSLVTVPIYSYSATFRVVTTTSTPVQTAYITATVGTIAKTASLAVTAAGAYTISSLSCTPAKLIPGAAAKCAITLGSAAPTGGLPVTLTSSRPSTLSVPASVTVAAGGNVAQFTATASTQVNVIETVTLTAAIPSHQKTLAVVVDPTALFHLSGTTAEMIGLANGTPVYPTTAPASWRGTVNVRGSGYVSFAPGADLKGLSFRQGGAQNVNTAFINFTGDGFANLFDADGEISFTLKSAYTFAERKALPAPNFRFAFEVFDASVPHFHFMSYVSNGQLMFGYSTRGVSAFYTLPVGREDALFGRDVAMKVRIMWTANTSTLYINDQLVRTATFSPKVATWSSLSALTIGARNVRYNTGGFHASEDAISDFKIR